MIETDSARKRVTRRLTIDDGDLVDALHLQQKGKEEAYGARADDENCHNALIHGG